MAVSQLPSDSPPPPNPTSPLVEELLQGARYGDLEDVEAALLQGVLVDSQDVQGRTALHMAAANGHLEVVLYLISHGADVNARNAEDNSPLHWAALNGHKQVVEELISRGANSSALNRYERTPLDEALSGGRQDVVAALHAATAAAFLDAVNVSQCEVLMSTDDNSF